MTRDRTVELWRTALLSEDHELPVVAIREGRIHEANAAARELFMHADAGRPVEELFVESSREELRTLLRGRASGSTAWLEVSRDSRPHVGAKLLLLALPGEQLLLVTPAGMGRTADTDLANPTRERAQAREPEQRLRDELEEVVLAMTTVTETVADLPRADVTAVLSMIALQAQSLTHADYAALGIGSDPERSFDPWVFLGVPEELARAIGRFPRPVGTLGRVARDGEVLRLPDLRRHTDFRGMPAHHPEMAAFLGLPIEHRGRSIGNLYLAKRPGATEFTERDERLMRTLAARVAAIIEMAFVYVSAQLQHTWLQSVIDQMPGAVLLYDQHGVLKATSQGVTALACRTPESADVFGNPNLIEPRAIDGSILAPERWPIARVLREHEVIVREEMLVRRGAGELTPVEVSAAPVRDAAGTISGGMVIVQDISDRKELERLKDEWTAIVAHDLRQPVNTIGMAAGLLLHRPLHELSEWEQRSLERIEFASRRLTRMINDLLDAACIESRRMALDCHPVELGPLVASVVDELGDVLSGHEVRIDVGARQIVRVDPCRMHQVLVNLISNAAKYGSPGTGILIEAIPGDEWVEVVVTNRGPGIPPEQLALLFSRFRRTRGARESRTPGLGLGLYIARGLVEAHGGRLWAESILGETTSFHFTVPAAIVRSASAAPRRPPRTRSR